MDEAPGRAPGSGAASAQPPGAGGERDDEAGEQEERAAAAKHAQRKDRSRRQRPGGEPGRAHVGRDRVGGEGQDRHERDQVEADGRIGQGEGVDDVRRARGEKREGNAGHGPSRPRQLRGRPGQDGHGDERSQPERQEGRDAAQEPEARSEKAGAAGVVDLARHEPPALEQGPHRDRAPELPGRHARLRRGARQVALEAEPQLRAVGRVDADLRRLAASVEVTSRGHRDVLPVAPRRGQVREIGARVPVGVVPQEQRGGRDPGEQEARHAPLQLTPPSGSRGRAPARRRPGPDAVRTRRARPPPRSTAGTARGS